MREGKFIEQNIDRWKDYEQPSEDPDEVAKRFIYLVDDLSYAKTFYPFSNTVRYINSIAAGIYLSIYKNKKQKGHRIVTFWTKELPLIMYQYRRTLLFSFLFFAAFVAIGAFSAAHDDRFIRGVLGNDYVNMTEDNISSGDPFGVYKRQNELSMFLWIASHNIKVSFIVFVTGICFSVGTLYSMFENGLSLGVFEYMFFHNGLGIRSILVVFIHGTLEISALVIAGCAGLVLGNSILFPKTYTRIQSLKMAAKNSVKIIVSLVPIFITAAFFESFVTRHTEMPLAMSLLILVSSLTFVLWYFVYYPIRVHKRNCDTR